MNNRNRAFFSKFVELGSNLNFYECNGESNDLQNSSNFILVRPKYIPSNQEEHNRKLEPTSISRHIKARGDSPHPPLNTIILHR